MKKIMFLILLSFSCFPIMTWSQGVNWEDRSFEAAVQKAIQENKLIFLDFYTSWCGPCGWMNTNVFTQKKVGDFQNLYFISIKFDAEKEPGKTLKKSFEIGGGYPTYHVIDPRKLVSLHRIVGTRGPDALIATLERARSATDSHYALEEKRKNSRLTNRDLYLYWRALSDANLTKELDTIEKELETSLSDKEFVEEEYWHFLSHGGYTSDHFQRIIKYFDRLEQNIPEKKLHTHVYDTYNRALNDLFARISRSHSINLEIHDVMNKMMNELRHLDFAGKDELHLKIEIINNISSLNIKSLGVLWKELCQKAPKKHASFILTGIDQVYKKASLDEVTALVGICRSLQQSDLEERVTLHVKQVVGRLQQLYHVGVFFPENTLEETLKYSAGSRKSILIFNPSYMNKPIGQLLRDKEVGMLINDTYICYTTINNPFYKNDLHENPAKKQNVPILILNYKNEILFTFTGNETKTELLEILDKYKCKSTTRIETGKIASK